MILPSKELLSEVLGADVTSISIISEKEIKLHGTEIWDEVVINIYELQHKIKEWMLSKHYIIKIEHHYFNTHRILLFKRGEEGYREPWKTTFRTEFDAVVQAGEWVLAKMDGKDD